MLSRSSDPEKTSWRKVKLQSSSFKTLNNLGHTYPVFSSFSVVFTSFITDILISKVSFVHTKAFNYSLFPYIEGSFLVFSHLYTYSFIYRPVQPKLVLPRLCWQLPHTLHSNFSEILHPWLSEPFIWYLSSTFWHLFCSLHPYLIFYVSFHLC